MRGLDGTGRQSGRRVRRALRASTLDIPALRHRVLHCRTFSKTYAMAGWRCGCLVAPTDLAPALRRLHMACNGAINASVQRIGLFALRAGPVG